MWEILLDRWKEEGLEVIVAIWALEASCSMLDLEFNKASNWAHGLEVNGNEVYD